MESREATNFIVPADEGKSYRSSTVLSMEKTLKLRTIGRPKKIDGSRSRNYRQNPSRNIITNIGNQLLTYLSNPTKSRTQLKLTFPHFREEEFEEFYGYMRNVKKQTDYYLNAKKMNDFWYPEHPNAHQELNYQCVRLLSHQFLNDVLPTCILTSTKMKKETKWHHLRIRRELLGILKRTHTSQADSEH
jgi:hypothetical protein